MPKYFEHYEVRDLKKFYKELLNKLKINSKLYEKYKKNLENQIQYLQGIGFFSSLVTDGIQGKRVDLNNNNIISLITNIYLFKESSKKAEICNNLYNTYGKDIEKNISLLSSASNPVFWLFSTKKKKNNIEKTYSELLDFKNDTFIHSVNEVIKFIDGLNCINSEIVLEDYLNNINEYKFWVNKIDLSKNSSYKAVIIFKNCEMEYKQLNADLSSVNKSLTENAREIRKTIDVLLSEELVNSLRTIPVEELARDKSGIRTKYLRDAGYDNLADILGASAIQLGSIYGISQDKAYTIKSKCDNYAKNLCKELKIKLSLDNKTKSATMVVQSVYSYLKIMDCSKRIDDLDAKYNLDYENAFKTFSELGNGIDWIFLNDEEKEHVISIYNFANNTLTNEYKPLVFSIMNDFKNRRANANVAWEDFGKNSIAYYNAVEEVYPGALGKDMSIYGLPEELARKIRDECFFPDGLLCTLRKYQEWGVKYILHQEKVLLGDEMGLGKTIQAIATMVSLKNTGATHFMVVCPASVVTNWCREIVKHSRLRVTKIHGKGKSAAFKSWLKIGGVAVINYESTSSINFDDSYKFSLLVVDEAHYIKNIGAIRSINTREIANHSDRLLFMTGTALENNVYEMISLINVLRPSIAEELKYLAFMSQAPEFREKIAPVYYRRKREDVLTELPDKIESNEWCTLSVEEEQFYENAILNRKYQEARRVSWNIDDLNKSCKAQRLKEIIEQSEAEGRKVIVFSFFLDTINKIHEFLKGRCLNPINGSVNLNRRQEILDEFDKAPPGKVLLAQINSGGTGLNIQSASVVVICEPQFKPSIENQAISRAYRMGQSRNVLVYRLLCEETIDEKLIEVLEEKQKIFDAFADKSVAAQQSLDIDDKKFGEIIEEEIERINKKRNSKPKEEKPKIKKEVEVSEQLKMYDYTPIIVKEEGKNYYQKIMKMDYDELVQFLINKYGPAKCDYYTNEYCTIKNRNVTRTNEGLYCHHIDEDKAILLSEDKYASKYPFAYQKANRLVYCNYLEHLLLHILIIEKTKDKIDKGGEITGVGGAVFYMCKQLNDLYNGYKFKMGWLINTTNIVKNEFESYIIMLKRLWHNIESSIVLSSLISKKQLAMGWEGNIYSNILSKL